MTYPISDQFNDPKGRWNEFAPWDGTEHSNGAKGFLTTQSHVDIRNFRGSGESWILTGTGLDSLVVGPLDARGGWSALKTMTTGAAIAATLTSSLATSVDISTMDFVSLIFPDHNSFDGDSTIKLSSAVDGSFGSGHDSAAIAFSSSLDPMPEFRVARSAFNNTGFDNTKVTGVRISLLEDVAPSDDLAVTALALRGTTTDWGESALDFDTLLGALIVPVTLDGADYSGDVAQAFEFVRGDGSKLDPIPADGAYYLYFSPGGATSPNKATGSDHNTVAIIMREQKDIGAGTGSHIEARLKFNDAETLFESVLVTSSGGSPGTVVESHSHALAVGGNLNSSKHYVFRVELRGTQVLATIYETDSDLVVGAFVWSNPTTITDSNYVYKNGRVGFIADLLTRDAYVSAFDVATTGFAVFQTQQYASRTPVDGAQLAAVYSEDQNLFQSVVGPDLFIDQTKTLSGLGSYRTARSLTTNSFIVDDWTQTYLSLAIWVPNNVTVANQPIILINTGMGQESIPLDRLQPSQWNRLYFDLGIFRDLATAASYSIQIQAAPSPDRALGFFWVDEIVVGRRRVSWAIRASENNPWREFKSMVNRASGAVHFTPEERGADLQLMATALTEDAWVSSFKLFPRYAQLGLPVYDQGFETT